MILRHQSALPLGNPTADLFGAFLGFSLDSGPATGPWMLDVKTPDIRLDHCLYALYVFGLVTQCRYMMSHVVPVSC